MMFLTLALLSAAQAETWVLEEELFTQVRPPVSPAWVEGRTLSQWLVSWSPEAPVFQAQLCSLEVDPVMGAKTSWSEAAVDAIPPLIRPVTFDGQHFEAGPVEETMGATDDDGDGNPGISVQVSHPRAGSGTVFVRQTAILSWTGDRGADGVIRGTMIYDPEQETLGATTWWLRLPMAQRAHKRRTSTFSLRPVDDGDGCPAPS